MFPAKSGSPLAILLVLALWSAPAGGLCGEAADEGQRGQVLLLKNGQVLRGTVTSTVDRYQVALEHGRVQVPSRDVTALCDDLRQAYAVLRSQSSAGGAGYHLQLALWCHRQGLQQEAKDELAQAMAIDAADPRIDQVRRRLAAPVASSSAVPVAATAAPVVSIAELDRMVRSLPGSAAEEFARNVQPLLLNHCATAGCHSSTAQNGFRLLKLPHRQAQARRITQRNLHSVLKHVDRAQPAESKLLQSIAGPHGGEGSELFGAQEQAQLAQLATWVTTVATPRVATAQPASVSLPRPALSQNLPVAPGLGRGSLGRTPRRPTGVQPAGRRSNNGIQRVPLGGSHGVAGDEFDPAEFNERYAPELPPVEEE